MAIFAGGDTASGSSNIVDIYNASAPAGHQWSTATLPQAVSYLAATTVGTKAIFAGGDSSEVYIYDASTEQWSSSAVLPQGFWGMAATTVGTKAIFAGGYTLGGNPSEEVFIYDNSTGQCKRSPAPLGISPASRHLGV